VTLETLLLDLSFLLNKLNKGALLFLEARRKGVADVSFFEGEIVV